MILSKKILNLFSKILIVAISICGLTMLSGCDTFKNQDGTINKKTVGIATGAVIGGIAGSAFGGGTGRIIATAAGATVGAVAGNVIGGKMEKKNPEVNTSKKKANAH